MDNRKKLKEIDKAQSRLEKRRARLEAKMEKERAADAKLDKIFETSGYNTPRALVKALINRYNLRLGAARAAAGGARKRTKVTPQLRNDIKKAVKGGKSKMAVSKDFGISYAVVTNVMKGKYDKMK